MKTYNTAPYYDDFDDKKNFHQILFKPGYAVQARELTQLQTILRGQIEKFGNHIFKHGSVVIPGNANADLNTPFIKVQPLFNDANIQLSQFENKIIIGMSTGIKALVKKIVPAEGTDPITFYLTYITGGGSSQGNIFLAGEDFYVESAPAIMATTLTSDHSGIGSLAFINKGVFYIRGSFVHIDAQSAVISKYTSIPSCHVLLKITESTITETQDESLLDPAQGSYNYAAPGADRFVIDLTLTVLPLGSVISDDYVELMRYNEGILEEHAKYPSYSELEKSLARRTYDESGNYLVNGFGHSVREHLKTQFNNGVYAAGDRNKFVVEVQPGKGYIEGLEVEVIAKKTIALDKARTADHIKTQTASIQNLYGRYIYVTNLKSLPNFNVREVVNLYNDSNIANGSATNLGSVRVVAIDYHAGDPSSTNSVYKLYIDELTLSSGYTFADVAGIRFASGAMTVVQKLTVPNPSVNFTTDETISNVGTTRVGKVVQFYRSTGELYAYRSDPTKSIPLVGDLITASASGASGTIKNMENIGAVNNGSAPIFTLPTVAIRSIKNIETNRYDIAYTAWKNITIYTDSSGSGTATITDGTILAPEAGNIVAASTAGIISPNLFSLSAGGTQLTLTGGPISSTVNALIQVSKSDLAPKSKTLTTHTLSNVTPQQIISLGKADIYRIVLISDANGIDVTDSYRLDNGQTDYYYGLGTLTLAKSLPTTNLTITFEYFEHSGSGDFFCVDSYATLGSDYIARATKYASKITSQIYDLAKCLDFRPTVGINNSFDSGGPSLIDIPVVGTFDFTSVQYYVPRIDIVYLNKDKTVGVMRGIPKDIPVQPVIPESSIAIAIIFIPAYTVSLADIMSRSLKNYRYTMGDIKKLETRIGNIEYYSTLNSLETSLLSYDIVDPATGLNRFKTGYLADNFENTFTVCDFFNRNNRCTFFNRNLSSAVEDHGTNISVLDSSSNYQLTGNQISLRYTETPFISQTAATRVTNLNPFMVFSWEGMMTIDPPFDTWVEMQDLPTIYNTVEKNVTVRIPRNDPPPRPAPAPSFSSVWDDPSPAPVPAPEPTREVIAFARDLGLVDPSLQDTPAWGDIVTFTIPETVFNQTYAQIDGGKFGRTGTGDWESELVWERAISEINTAYNSAISATSSTGTVDTSNSRFTADQIINYWHDDQPQKGVI